SAMNETLMAGAWLAFAVHVLGFDRHVGDGPDFEEFGLLAVLEHDLLVDEHARHYPAAAVFLGGIMAVFTRLHSVQSRWQRGQFELPASVRHVRPLDLPGDRKVDGHLLLALPSRVYIDTCQRLTLHVHQLTLEDNPLLEAEKAQVAPALINGVRGRGIF